MLAGREIKFRGKRTHNGEWVYGLPTFNRDCTGIDKIELPALSGGVCTLVDPKTVGQFTGVHDDQEEAVEFYDGDIAEVEYEEYTHVCLVKYEGCAPMFVADSLPDGFLWFTEILECDSGYWWVEGTKKIGNIYENPELLEAI